MRTLLRRRLNEVLADNWQDEDLNDVLNLALHRVQKRILTIEPEAFLYIANAPITINQEFIAKPVGMWYEKEVRLLDTATGLYGEIDRLPYHTAKTLTSGDTAYAHFGRFFAIRPIPAASILAGLQVLYVPTLTMAVDSDVPDVNLGLHDAIVKAALLTLLPETGEAYKEVKEQYEEDMGDVHLYYRMSASANQQLEPVVPKDY